MHQSPLGKEPLIIEALLFARELLDPCGGGAAEERHEHKLPPAHRVRHQDETE